jgi:hypothetical protein
MNYRPLAFLFSNTWQKFPSNRPAMPQFLSELHSIIASRASGTQSSLPTGESTIRVTDSSIRAPIPIREETDPMSDEQTGELSNVHVVPARPQHFINYKHMKPILQSAPCISMGSFDTIKYEAGGDVAINNTSSTGMHVIYDSLSPITALSSPSPGIHEEKLMKFDTIASMSQYPSPAYDVKSSVDDLPVHHRQKALRRMSRVIPGSLDFGRGQDPTGAERNFGHSKLSSLNQIC